MIVLEKPPSRPASGAAKGRDEILQTLRAHETWLRRAGIIRLSVFGSTARGTAGEESDVDLLARFDPARRLSIIDLAGLELDLADLLGRPVDLIQEGTLKPRIQQVVEREIINAY